MSLDHDPWIMNRSALPAEKLHALGYITFAWNACEYWTGAIFSIVSGIDQSIGRIITHDLGDVGIWKKVREISENKNHPIDVIDLLNHSSRFYDICRINRNTYVHATGGLIGRGGISLIRRKGPKQFGDYIPDGLNDLRRVCEDLDSLNHFLEEVAMYIMDLNEGIRNLPPPAMPPLPNEVWISPKKSGPKKTIGSVDPSD